MKEKERLRRDPDAIDHINEMNVAFVKAALRAKRKELGLTQTQLADAVGVNQPTISVLESPKTNRVTLTILQRVAAGLGCVIKMDLVSKDAFLESM